MNRTELSRELSARFAVRASVLVLLVLALAGNLASWVYLLLQKRETRIELQVPARISHGGWFTEDRVSTSYMIDTAFQFVELALNVSASTIETQTQILLHYAAPEYEGAMLQAFKAAEEKLRAEQASTVFWPARYAIDPGDKNRVAIFGTLATYVADKRVSETPKVYRLTMRWSHWRAAVSEFVEVDGNDPFGAGSSPGAGQ